MINNYHIWAHANTTVTTATKFVCLLFILRDYAGRFTNILLIHAHTHRD